MRYPCLWRSVVVEQNQPKHVFHGNRARPVFLNPVPGHPYAIIVFAASQLPENTRPVWGSAGTGLRNIIPDNPQYFLKINFIHYHYRNSNSYISLSGLLLYFRFLIYHWEQGNVIVHACMFIFGFRSTVDARKTISQEVNTIWQWRVGSWCPSLSPLL